MSDYPKHFDRLYADALVVGVVKPIHAEGLEHDGTDYAIVVFKKGCDVAMRDAAAQFAADHKFPFAEQDFIGVPANSGEGDALDYYPAFFMPLETNTTGGPMEPSPELDILRQIAKKRKSDSELHPLHILKSVETEGECLDTVRLTLEHPNRHEIALELLENEQPEYRIALDELKNEPLRDIGSHIEPN